MRSSARALLLSSAACARPLHRCSSAPSTTRTRAAGSTTRRSTGSSRRCAELGPGGRRVRPLCDPAPYAVSRRSRSSATGLLRRAPAARGGRADAAARLGHRRRRSSSPRWPSCRFDGTRRRLRPRGPAGDRGGRVPERPRDRGDGARARRADRRAARAAPARRRAAARCSRSRSASRSSRWPGTSRATSSAATWWRPTWCLARAGRARGGRRALARAAARCAPRRTTRAPALREALAPVAALIGRRGAGVGARARSTGWPTSPPRTRPRRSPRWRSRCARRRSSRRSRWPTSAAAETRRAAAGVCSPATSGRWSGKSGEKPARSRHCNRVGPPHARRPLVVHRTTGKARQGHQPGARRPTSGRQPRIPRGRGGSST